MRTQNGEFFDVTCHHMYTIQNGHKNPSPLPYPFLVRHWYVQELTWVSDATSF